MHQVPPRALLFAFLLTTALTARAQWQILDSNTTADLRGIENIGNGIVWASGSNGTVLRSEDAGYVWQHCAIPPNAEHLDFRGIQAFDANTAIVMSSGKGPLSRLYKTTDGCQTWKLLFTNPDPNGFWDAIRFDKRKPGYASADWTEHERGIMVGDPIDGKFVIYKTSDSGKTWSPWPNDNYERPAHAAKAESLFAASNSAAIATGDFGNLAFVTGGRGGSHFFNLQRHDPFDGRSWLAFDRTHLPITSGDNSGAFSIYGRGSDPTELNFMVVGGDYLQPNVSGSAVFLPARNYCCFGLIAQKTVRATTPPHGYRSAVAYDPAHKLWITVGPNGTDISTDDGRNWRALHPDPALHDPPDADRNWNALSLPFVVGPKGRIGRLEPSALPVASH